ncbi:MAG: hypothetical protein WCB31_02480 [Nitrososphaeraceae archaeon]
MANDILECPWKPIQSAIFCSLDNGIWTKICGRPRSANQQISKVV